MIYSKTEQTYIPTTIKKRSYDLKNFGMFTKYDIYDGKILMGYVDLQDTPKGVYVEYIENLYPNKYSGLGKTADQIEVEHCLKRGLDTFEITSHAALNSHAAHYLRGKRFGEIQSKSIEKKMAEKFHTINPNIIVKQIIDSTPKGEKCVTNFLGKIPMFMPQEMINKYIKIIKESPLLK